MTANKTAIGKAITLLKKVYHHSNTDYESNYQGVGYKTDFLTSEQCQLLEQVNLVPNSFEQLTHESQIDGLLSITKDARLTVDFATTLFVSGLSGEVPRYRQTLMSFWFARGMTKHAFVKSETHTGCASCGLPQVVVEDRTHNLFTYHLGHSWNESPQAFLTELEEILQFPKPKLMASDKERFRSLLVEIDKAKPSETPGQLEKRIRKSALLPKTDKYKRYGILQTLAVVGVLPSQPELDEQGQRSDIVLPLAGWRGKLGVDFQRAKALFKV